MSRFNICVTSRHVARVAVSLLGAVLLTGCGSMHGSMSGPVPGMVVFASPHSAIETMSRLEAEVKQRGLNVFARIDHAAGAQRVGQTLRPTELLVFGNPQGGTPLMQCAQTVGIDLPLKALVWEDASSKVWLGYNDPAYVMRRHGERGCAPAEKVATALDGIVKAVVKP